MCFIGFGPSFVKHPLLGKILATEEGNATIPCDPEAAPKATITWEKDGVVSVFYCISPCICQSESFNIAFWDIEMWRINNSLLLIYTYYIYLMYSYYNC